MADKLTPSERMPIVVIADSGPRHVHHSTTVHEHRAPTDASVRLLKEMEEAATKKVVKSIHVGNTLVECVVHTWLDVMSDCIRMRAIFKVNGVTETADHEYRPRGEPLAEIDAWRALRAKVADVIANKMIGDAMLEQRTGW